MSTSIADARKEHLPLPFPLFLGPALSRLPRLIVELGLRRRLALLAERQARYRRIGDPEEIARWQLLAVNSVWRMATTRFRFYAEWKRRHRLPDRLADIADLSRFPILL